MKSLATKKKRVGQIALFCVMMLTMVVMMSMGVFASTEDLVAIEASDLEPVLAGAKANISVVIPVGVGIFTMLLGIGFLPTIIKRFRNGA